MRLLLYTEAAQYPQKKTTGCVFEMSEEGEGEKLSDKEFEIMPAMSVGLGARWSELTILT